MKSKKYTNPQEQQTEKSYNIFDVLFVLLLIIGVYVILFLGRIVSTISLYKISFLIIYPIVMILSYILGALSRKENKK